MFFFLLFTGVLVLLRLLLFVAVLHLRRLKVAKLICVKHDVVSKTLAQLEVEWGQERLVVRG